MRYKIAVCDDSDADRNYVLNMVHAWSACTGHAVHTDDFPSAESFLFHYATECDYDILLLDIEMGTMDGVTMAKELRKSNDTLHRPIVFDTFNFGGIDTYICTCSGRVAAFNIVTPFYILFLISLLHLFVTFQTSLFFCILE